MIDGLHRRLTSKDVVWFNCTASELAGDDTAYCYIGKRVS